VEFEFDAKNLLYVRIDRKRKFLATTFLRALGLGGDEEILRQFYAVSTIQLKGNELFWKLDENLIGHKLTKDITDPSKKKAILVAAAGRSRTAPTPC